MRLFLFDEANGDSNLLFSLENNRNLRRHPLFSLPTFAQVQVP